MQRRKALGILGLVAAGLLSPAVFSAEKAREQTVTLAVSGMT